VRGLEILGWLGRLGMRLKMSASGMPQSASTNRNCPCEFTSRRTRASPSSVSFHVRRCPMGRGPEGREAWAPPTSPAASLETGGTD